MKDYYNRHDNDGTIEIAGISYFLFFIVIIIAIILNVFLDI